MNNNLDEGQKAYKTTNTLRKVTMFIGWVATIFFFVLFIKTEDDSIISLLGGSMIIGSAIHGLVHAEFSLKKIKGNLGIIGIPICLLWGGCAIAVGLIFLIIDTILFCLKKPLIYSFEDKYFY